MYWFLFVITGLLSLKIEANAVITTDGQRNGISKWKNAAIDPRAGMELNYGDKFYLRAGGANVQYRIADDNQLEKQAFFQPSMGAGVTLKNITIDYGISSIGDFSNTTFSNIISLKLDFNKIR